MADRRLDPVGSLQGYAGLTALVLGATYGYGALVKMTQFRGAHQSSLDVLPLVPLEQVLLTGIREAVPLIVAQVAGLTAALVLRERRDRKGIKVTKDQPLFEWPDIFRPRKTWMDWVIQGSVVLLNVSLVLFTDPTFAVLIVWSWLFLWLATPTLTSLRRFVSILALSFVIVTVVQMYFDPDPLPRVSVDLKGGHKTKGELIVTSAAGVAVATGDHEFTFYSRDEVVHTAITSSDENEPSPSLWEKLTGQT